MIIKHLISLAGILHIFAITTQAQYVSPHQRNSIIKTRSIVVKKGEQLSFHQAKIYCDTLIMEDESAITCIRSLKSLSLYAKYCKIGKNCLITTRGTDGKSNAQVIKGIWATNAIPLRLYFNIYALGNLIIDARGGNGGDGFIPGIYGAGANIKLTYYAPDKIRFAKKIRQNPKKRSITILNKKGKMKLTQLHEVRHQYNRPVTYDTQTKNANLVAQKLNINRLITQIERVRKTRKNGQLILKTMKKPIASSILLQDYQ